MHRGYETAGLSFQLNHKAGQGWFKNHLSLGADLAYQSLEEFKQPNVGNAVEGPETQADQTMTQSGLGAFLIDRMKLGRFWSVSLSLRYNRVTNKLQDHLKLDGVDLSGRVDYSRATGRLGLAWNPVPTFGLCARWGNGFLPPETEELVNNPYAYGGYNTQLKAATSHGVEIGARGHRSLVFTYDVALFNLRTQSDFGRYRIVTRPLENFYGNVGSTNCSGLETTLGWFPVDKLAFRLAYTY